MADEGEGVVHNPGLEAWEQAKPYIQLYRITQDLPLNQVREKMKALGFIATEKMYKSKFNEWKLGKNTTAQDWPLVAKLFTQARGAGITDPSVMVHQKIRNPQDLHRYLARNGQNVDEFYRTSTNAQIRIPPHIYLCDSNGKQIVIPAGDTLTPTSNIIVSGHGLAHSQETPNNTLQLLQPEMHNFAQLRNQPTQTNRIEARPANSQAQVDFVAAAAPIPTSWRDGELQQQGIQSFDSIISTSAEGPISQRLRQAQLGYAGTGTMPTAFSEMSSLSSFRSIPEGTADQMVRNACGVNHQSDIFDTDNVFDTAVSSSQATSARGVGEDRLTSLVPYLSACMMACMYGAARKKSVKEKQLQQASIAFAEMCRQQEWLVLTAAYTMMTWLGVHQVGNLAKEIMQASLRVAVNAFGTSNNICTLLEWMLAVSCAKLKESFIDSDMLHRIWQDFHISLGQDHDHTMVALYCLAFHLINVDKQYAQAEQYLRDLYRVASRVIGPHSTQAITVLAALSRAQLRQNRLSLSLATINRAIEAMALNPNHSHRLELLVRKAVILRRLGRGLETEALYWTVTAGRVATLGRHHPSTLAAHDSLEKMLHENGTWDEKKYAAHQLLIDTEMSVNDYENWWRRIVDTHRADHAHDSSSDGE